MSEASLKRRLLASLLLNLFLIGGIAGGAWHWWTASATMQQPRGLRYAADQLSAEQRRNYLIGLRNARDEVNIPIRDAREGRREALRLLGASQFDSATVSAALARTREADMAARTRVETAVVDFAASLPPEDRRKLADGLARRSSLGGANTTPSK